MEKVNIAVIGVGVIGKRHIHEILENSNCRLVAIADPSGEAYEYAGSLAVPLYPNFLELLDKEQVDAVIVCTPNDTHLGVGLACLARKIPVLMEKPIADKLESAYALADAAKDAGVPLLVGHHRRHNSVVRAVKDLISRGQIGDIVIANILCLLYKPNEYFNAEWRRRPGGGPILINLIHEIDLIRYLCGEIKSVRAVSSKKIRHFEVEDSAACTLELLSGALANISLSDTTVSPWSWDTAAGEDRQLFDYRPVPTHFFAGTAGAISIPELTLWSYAGEKGRHRPINEARLPIPYENTYANQLQHFIDVVRGLVKPVIGGHDAARTLQATLAVIASAESGSTVDLQSA